MLLSKNHYILIIIIVITTFLSAFGGAYLGSYSSISSVGILNTESLVEEEFPDFNAPEDLLDESLIQMESKITRADEYIDNRTFEIAQDTTILLSTELTANSGKYSVELYQKGKVSPIYIDKGNVVSINKAIDLEAGTYQIVMTGKKLKNAIYDIKITNAGL